MLTRWAGLKDKVNQLIPCGQPQDDETPCPRHFRLTDVRNAAKKKKQIQCQGCLNGADPLELLVGIGRGNDPVAERLDRLDKNLQAGFEGIRQDIQLTQRTLLRALSDISKDAPRLFSMWPKAGDKSFLERFDPRKIGKQTYEVWLWCEHCEQPHPVKRYEKDVASEWLVKIAPIAKAVATVLKAAIPIAGGGLGLYLDQIGASKEDKKDIKERIESMSKLAEKCLTGELDTGRERKELKDSLSAPEGASLREFHNLLRELDTNDHWGDLRPTTTNEGDYLWMCEKHYKEFNPGLITIPVAAPK